MFPGSTAEKLQREVSLLEQSVKSEAGCLCFPKLASYTQEKIPLLEPWSVFEDFGVHRVQTLEKKFKTWTAFSLTSRFQSSSYQ